MLVYILINSVNDALAESLIKTFLDNLNVSLATAMHEQSAMHYFNMRHHVEEPMELNFWGEQVRRLNKLQQCLAQVVEKIEKISIDAQSFRGFQKKWQSGQTKDYMTPV